MAQIGGRNLIVAWIVGVLCVAVVLALVWFALPLFPALADFVNSIIPDGAG